MAKPYMAKKFGAERMGEQIDRRTGIPEDLVCSAPDDLRGRLGSFRTRDRFCISGV